MVTRRNFLGIASVVCVLALLTVPVSAYSQQDDTGRGAKITAHLDRLEEQGYDVSEIRAAIENDDQETARTLMRQFMEEHGDELGIPVKNEEFIGKGSCAGKGDCIQEQLDRFEEMGYDVSEIRAAIENDDQETAGKLMKEFMEEHREEIGTHARGSPGATE